MPSLKDLRNRIASVKATQKITKAMQMVAAAKLRRAQEAAEAARPYTQRMERGAGQSRRSGDRRPRHPASDDRDRARTTTHLLVVCTAERGLCGGFNSQIARLARDRIAEADRRRARRSRSCASARRADDMLKRQYERLIIDQVDLRDVKQIGFANAARHRRRKSSSCSTMVVRRLHALLSRNSSRSSARCRRHFSRSFRRSTRERSEEAGSKGAVYEYEPDETRF